MMDVRSWNNLDERLKWTHSIGTTISVIIFKIKFMFKNANFITSNIFNIGKYPGCVYILNRILQFLFRNMIFKNLKLEIVKG